LSAERTWKNEFISFASKINKDVGVSFAISINCLLNPNKNRYISQCSRIKILDDALHMFAVTLYTFLFLILYHFCKFLFFY
jgi:hypothetical protein